MKLKSFEENTTERTDLNLPNGWIVQKIGDIFDVSAGGDLDPDRSQDTKDEDHIYPIYANAIVGETTYGYSSYCDRKAGSITVTARGTLGFAAFRDHDFTAIGRLLVLEPKLVVNGRFIAEYINTCVKFLIESTGVPQLTAPQISKYQLLIPPLFEQNAIAKIALAWDNAFEALGKLIAAKQLITEALMQQLLTGRRRLTGFSGPWISQPIGAIASEISIKNTGRIEQPVLSCTKHKGLVPSLEYFGRQIYSIDLSGYKVVPRGTFAYATNHIEEGSIGYQSELESGLVSPMYTVFRTAAGVNDEFLFQLLKLPTYVNLYRSRTNGSVNRRGGLRWVDFSRIQVALPPIDEQAAISSLIHVATNEIQLLQMKLDLFKEQKKGLMQKLLTGEIRLKTE